MALDKKLGAWGKDRIIGEDNKFHAEDYYCFRCFFDGKEIKAEKFWEPIMDAGIGMKPYCNNCLEEIRDEIFRDLFFGGMD